MEANINTWNSLTPMQKRSFGDRLITHESNLNAWNKPFNELSEIKKHRVINSVINPKLLNNTIC